MSGCIFAKTCQSYKYWLMSATYVHTYLRRCGRIRTGRVERSMYVASHAHAMHARVCTGGEGQVEAASTRSRKTFFVKNVVRLMFQPLTLRKGQDSTSTLSSRLHIILKCSTSTTTSISHLMYTHTFVCTYLRRCTDVYTYVPTYVGLVGYVVTKHTITSTYT